MITVLLIRTRRHLIRTLVLSSNRRQWARSYECAARMDASTPAEDTGVTANEAPSPARAVHERASYDVWVRGCKEMKDAPSTYYLYPGTCLYYELVVVNKRDGAECSVLRRFSEVRKFWESIRPAAAAVGAPLEPFPPTSAFLSGGGYTGNLYETNPNSEFALERVATLRTLMSAFASKVDCKDGSLLELRQSRQFFEIDAPSQLAPPKNVVSAERCEQLCDPMESIDDAKAQQVLLKQEPFLGALTRSTPAAFVTVFVVVLAALYAFTPSSSRDD